MPGIGTSVVWWEHESVTNVLPEPIADRVACWPEFRMGVKRVGVQLAAGELHSDALHAHPELRPARDPVCNRLGKHVRHGLMLPPHDGRADPGHVRTVNRSSIRPPSAGPLIVDAPCTVW